MTNDSEEIDDSEIEMRVWYVGADTEGKPGRIVFDDSDEMLDYAHYALDALFDRLGEEDEQDFEILLIEQGKMTRGQWRAIQEKNRENDDE
jgi:hypothetical protein